MRRNDRLYKFWREFRFKYKLTILNERSLDELFAMRISWLSATVLLTITLLVMTLLVSSLILVTPITNLLPGYLDINARKDIVNNALKLDSLENISTLHDKYLETVKKIVSGDISSDSISTVDSLAVVDVSKLQPSAAELAFREKYEEEELYNLNAIATSSNGTIRFISPAKGPIISPFRKGGQLGVDLIVEESTPIVAVYDGVITLVIDQNKDGYLIQVQHTSDWISTYRSVAKPLRVEGDRVTAGEAIALAGKTGSDEKLSHLYFQLWNSGRAVNPEEYMTF
ncbi:MAG: murein hydrolase activator EnvC family protein [Bacteroidales bacterium]